MSSCSCFTVSTSEQLNRSWSCLAVLAAAVLAAASCSSTDAIGDYTYLSWWPWRTEREMYSRLCELFGQKLAKTLARAALGRRFSRQGILLQRTNEERIRFFSGHYNGLDGLGMLSCIMKAFKFRDSLSWIRSYTSIEEEQSVNQPASQR